MDILSKITFKNIAKNSVMYFVFGAFPLVTLLLFYNPLVSLLGLLFSYIGLLGTAFTIYSLFFIKSKLSVVYNFIYEKIDSITDINTYKVVKYSVIALGLGVSILTLYLAFTGASLFFKYIAFISALNPLMIIALNIYYLGMSFAYLEYSKGGIK